MTTETPWTEPGTTIVEPRGRKALKLRKGQKLRITDLEGQQVMDFITARVADPDERQSAMFTNVCTNSWELAVDNEIFSTKCTPLLRLLRDDNGHHALSGYCSEYSNEYRYGVKDTASCYGNLCADWEELGLDTTKISPDMCISVFMNILRHPDGRHEIAEPTTKAGDCIEFEALDDIYVGLSNCPEEHNPCNAFHLTPMEVTVF
jgi:uncharacterized protein